MKKKKLNINNLFTLIIFSFSLTALLFDFLVFTISMILGKMASYTWCGVISFVAVAIMFTFSAEELKEILDNKKEK